VKPVRHRFSAKAGKNKSLKERVEEVKPNLFKVKGRPHFHLSFAKDHKSAFAVIRALEIIVEPTKRILQSVKGGARSSFGGNSGYG